MTMRTPTGDFVVKGLTFSANKRYRFTWPGQSPVVASAEEIAAIVAGADPAVLDIHEAAPVYRSQPPAPKADDK